MSQTPDMPAAVPATIAAPEAAHAPTMAAPGNALTWPFHQRQWFGSLWILLVGWFPLPLPMILNFGWMFEAAERLGRREPEALPRAIHIPLMWLRGVFFFFAITLYFAIPLIIFNEIYAVVASRVTDDVTDWVVTWGWNQAVLYMNGLIALVAPYQYPLTPQPSIEGFLWNELRAYGPEMLLPIAVYVLAIAMFLAGFVRFAATGKLTSFFRPFKNVGLFFAHLPSFLWLVLLTLAINFAVGMLGFIGLVLWATVGMWLYAYLFGHLAVKMRDKGAIF